ncbi:MAG: hypothetical protein ABWY39_03215, partial [Mycobacterium sp.]
MALLAVIGVTAAVTMSVTGDNGGNGSPTSPPSGNNSGIASANDTGPATVITEDPSCAAWMPISETLGQMQRNGWENRNPAIPATEWTPQLRAQYDEVGQAMRSAADETAPIVKLTPHRAVRELYEQFIAYARAYSDAIPTYTPVNNHLVAVAGASATALSYLCGAINSGSAQARAPLVAAPAPPSEFASPDDPSKPQRFLKAPDPTCMEWDRLLHQFEADTSAWRA